jgi:m7GpppX diphosphatase
VQELHLIDETPDIYEKVTLPYLEKEQFTLDWVYNILEHKQEVDKIVYEDSDFILLPDYKWNGQKESLYLLAIVTDRSIKSLRDLNGSHLKLLSNIKSKSLEAIKSKYDLDASQIRAYFHYQPSFYHLHVHFTYLKFDAPGIFCEKSHLLTTVINNLRLLPDYYKKATLPFAAREKDKLYSAYKEFIESQADSS